MLISMPETTTAQDLHAGDWVVCPEGKAGGCWVASRRQEGETMVFTLGRASGHVHSDVVMSVRDEVEVLSRWPKMPSGQR